ncbi:hypothetical protein PQR14_02930 [Paraburkholderia bryophila]|uniref:hypothetical protein n=1 Tax=Paraburkholderia bryophila TaxID=420952 RepID=UPI0038BD693A
MAVANAALMNLVLLVLPVSLLIVDLGDAKRSGPDRICVHQPLTNTIGQPPRDSAEPALAR